MNIVYIDLNEPSHSEDYSISPKRYGGGRVFASVARETSKNDNENDNFWLLSDVESFHNVGREERLDRCFPITAAQKAAIRNGTPIQDVIKGFWFGDIDLIVHHFTNIWINTAGLKTKQVAWSVGYREQIHKDAPYIILYNDYQEPILLSPNTKILKARIGKPIPGFQEYKKEDYIFQCSRHTPVFGSIHVAKFCQANKIKAIFAGPIDNGYPLMNYIDNKYTFYKGVITEERKLELTSKARLYTFLHAWPTPFNLSAIESLGYGTPIVATPMGFWPSLVTEKNGFLISEEKELLNAWEQAPNISQRECHNTASHYSEKIMLSEFYTAFQKVLE
jgi:glycosyltransferase involved in cell wall biosynthesis